MATQITVDATKTGGEISPLWFGHNLEHTRSCLWRGLSAQLIANRKFAGMPQHNGVASGWYPTGSRESWCLLEMMGGYKGTDGEPYTGHYDPRNGSDCQRQRIECFKPSQCGIGQRGIPLVKGQRYRGRFALQADREVTVSIRAEGEPVSPGRFQVGPGRWTEAEFKFTARKTDDDARIEVTFGGPGVLHVGMASLRPADHFLGMRRDVVELLKEMGVPLLRWPGGNFAGDYRWQDGLLPAHRRAPLRSAFFETLPHTDGYDMHEIGTDEFIALCRELGAEPFLTLNLSFEGPEEAAAWVEYCNGGPDTKWGGLRAERGHAEPYRVKHWTLGNEMGYSHMRGPHGPKEYGELAAACARAMRKVDPSLVFTASTGWSEAWYQGLLASGEDYYDHISHHTYNTLPRAFEGEKGAAEFRHLTSCPDIIFRTRARGDGYTGETRLTMLDMRDLINESPRGQGTLEQGLSVAPPASSGESGCHAQTGLGVPGERVTASPSEETARPVKPIGIAFDEWNVWYGWYREPGVAEGIYAALMLNSLCRESLKLGVTIGCYFQPVNEGAILVEPDSAHLTPIGQAHSLFKAHYHNQLIEVARSHKRLACGEENESDAAEATAPDDADIDLAASLNPETRALTLTMVNRSPEASQSVEIHLENATPKKIEGILLSSDSFRPGSVFRRSRLGIQRKGETFSVTLPPHSVARVMCL